MESISAVWPPEPRTMRMWEGEVRGGAAGRREGRMWRMRSWGLLAGCVGGGKGEHTKTEVTRRSKAARESRRTVGSNAMVMVD